MSIKISCETINKGITLPTDKTGLNWARETWLWLYTYTESEFCNITTELNYKQIGQIIALLALLRDTGVITVDLHSTLCNEVYNNEYSHLHSIAGEQVNIFTRHWMFSE